MLLNTMSKSHFIFGMMILFGCSEIVHGLGDLWTKRKPFFFLVLMRVYVTPIEERMRERRIRLFSRM